MDTTDPSWMDDFFTPGIVDVANASAPVTRAATLNLPTGSGLLAAYNGSTKAVDLTITRRPILFAVAAAAQFYILTNRTSSTITFSAANLIAGNVLTANNSDYWTIFLTIADVDTDANTAAAGSPGSLTTRTTGTGNWAAGSRFALSSMSFSVAAGREIYVTPAKTGTPTFIPFTVELLP